MSSVISPAARRMGSHQACIWVCSPVKPGRRAEGCNVVVSLQYRGLPIGRAGRGLHLELPRWTASCPVLALNVPSGVEGVGEHR